VTIKATDEWSRAEKDAARAILLEPSPYESDGGELIGRDPRKIPVEEFNRAGLEGHPLSKVIRAKCLDCCVQQEAEVRKCTLFTCPNWPYRLGSNPFRTRDLTDEQREAIGERLKAARRPSPDFSPVNNKPKTSPATPEGEDAP
jgi:hypothetical protein